MEIKMMYWATKWYSEKCITSSAQLIMAILFSVNQLLLYKLANYACVLS